MIALKCTQCGASLETESSRVEAVGKVYTLHKETRIACKHCGTEYANEETLEKYVQVGGVHISGNITVVGDVVGGDKIEIRKTSTRIRRND